MREIIRDSATKLNAGDKLPGIVPFRLDVQTQTQPSVFEAVMMIEGVRYQYGFSATTERIHNEWLNAWLKGRKTRWLERRFDPASEMTAWNFGGPLQRDAQILKDRTRDNRLALSRGAELNVQLLEPLFLWYRSGLWLVDLASNMQALALLTVKRLAEDAKRQAIVGRLLQHADSGISELRLSSEEVPTRQRQFIFFHGEQEQSLEAIGHLRMVTLHRVPGLADAVEFGMDQESDGTQRFSALATLLFDAFDQGSVVVVDELECSMHPLLARKLIELFQSPEVNKNGAQLIFATHDSTLMDQELFRRDQIWLCEKNREGATELFSLYDFKPEDRPRSTTALQRNYLAGRYGGVPTFGRTFEDLQIE